MRGDQFPDKGFFYRSGQLAFACGLAIANAEAMPHWNPGDECEAARRAALAEVAAGAGGQR